VQAEFMVQPPRPPRPPARPDKNKIKDALKCGQDVPGCRLEQGVRLEVKP